MINYTIVEEGLTKDWFYFRLKPDGDIYRVRAKDRKQLDTQGIPMGARWEGTAGWWEDAKERIINGG